MATVSSVNSAGADASGLAASTAQELSDRFLTMLTAQMRNQDPLNPLDNAELTSQMAQISTVTGVSQLNTTMQWLGYNMSALQSTQATSLIGHQVLVSGDVLSLKDGAATGGYTLSLPVENAELRIYNADKTEVGRVNLGARQAGTYTFDWDGKGSTGAMQADANYTFEVVVGSGTDTGVAPTLSTATITSVRPSASGTVVLDSKGNSIKLSDVYQVW